eukprot:1654822-Rhodomonas_salina.3
MSPVLSLATFRVHGLKFEVVRVRGLTFECPITDDTRPPPAPPATQSERASKRAKERENERKKARTREACE